MARIGAVVMAAVLVALAGACTSERTPTAAPSVGQPVGADGGPEGAVDLLYVARGPASIQGSELTLTADPTVTWIADRPARAAGRLAAEQLGATWRSAGFDDDPPNAVLVAGSRSVPVELTSLVSAEAGRMVFGVRSLGGPLPTGDLGPAELFIDDAATCTDGTVTVQVDGLPPELLGRTTCASLTAPFDDWIAVLGQASQSGGPTFPVTEFGLLWECTLAAPPTIEQSIPFGPTQVQVVGPPSAFSCTSDGGADLTVTLIQSY